MSSEMSNEMSELSPIEVFESMTDAEKEAIRDAYPIDLEVLEQYIPQAVQFALMISQDPRNEEGRKTVFSFALVEYSDHHPVPEGMDVNIMALSWADQMEASGEIKLTFNEQILDEELRRRADPFGSLMDDLMDDYDDDPFEFEDF